MKKNKGIILLMIFAFVLVSMCSCQKTKKSSTDSKDSPSFKVNEDDSFVVTYSEDFSKDYYSKDELDDMVNKEIMEFNETLATDKENGIVKDSLTVKKNEAVLKLKFFNYQDYITYTKNYVNDSRNMKLFIGTYEDAIAAGYSFGTTFTKVEDLSSVSIDEIKEDKKLYIFYTNEGLTVSIDGEIVATGKYVEVKDGLVKTTDKRENYVIYKK